MKLDKGLVKQLGRQSQPEGTTFAARNIVIGNTINAPSNEPSTSLAYSKGNYVGATNVITFTIDEDTNSNNLITSVLTNQNRQVLGLIAIENKVVVFSKGTKGNAGFDEIGLVTRNNEIGKYEVIIRSAYLNFQLHNPIKGVATVNFYKQIVVAWIEGVKSDCNNIRLLNISCLPFSLTATKELAIPSEVGLLELFADYKTPTFELVSVNKTGGNLRTGVYYIVAQYEYVDGSTSTFFPIQNPISIISDSPTTIYSQVNGALPDTASTYSITIRFSNLDTIFKKVKLYVIKEINNVKSAFYITTLKYGSTFAEYKYTGLSLETPISVESLLVNSAIYTKAFGIANYADELDIANVVTEDDLDLQQTANNIIVKWKTKEVDLHNRDNGFKDGKFTFYNKSFKAGEVYALYVRGITQKGGRTKAFHIAGRLATDDLGVINGDPNAVGDRRIWAFSDDDSLNIGNVRYFQTRETAYGITAVAAQNQRLMGYWENADEVYDGTCMGLDKDGEPLSGKNVRHHRFPSIKTLLTEGEFKTQHALSSWTLAEVANNGTEIFIAGGGITTNAPFTSASDPVQPAKFGGNTFIANEDVLFDFNLNAYLPTGGSYLGDIWYSLVIFNSNNTVNDIISSYQECADSSALPVGLNQLRYSKTIKLLKGQKLAVRFSFTKPYNTSGGTITIPQFKATFLPIAYSGNNSTKGKVLGLEFSNIVIPSEIDSKVFGLEFFYAKRTFNNSIIVSEVLMVDDEFRFTSDLDAGLYPKNVTDVRLHSFDINFFLPEKSANYVNVLLEYNKGNYAVTDFANEIKLITDLEYRTTNNSINNDSKEATLHGTLIGTPISNIHPDNFYVAELCSYKTNLYLEFFSQELVSAGEFLINDHSGNLTYGNAVGDVYKNLYGFRVKKRSYPVAQGDELVQLDKPKPPRILYLNYRDFLPFLDSAVNVDYRNVLSEPLSTFNHDRYFPFSNMYGLGFPVENNSTNFYDRDNVHKYNVDYSALNDFSQAKINRCETNCDNNTDKYYPSRIARSLSNKNEEFVLNWRIFLPDSYYEMPKTRGEIWNIDTDGHEFYINHKYGFYVAVLKDVLSFNEATAYLGSGDIFDRAPIEVSADKVGSIGCQSRWGCLVTKHGYLITDRKKGKVFLYNKGIKDLTEGSMTDWFDVNLNTLTTTALGTIFNTANKEEVADSMDNPFTQIGLCIGYDAKLSRFLLTKHDYEILGDFSVIPQANLVTPVTVIVRRFEVATVIDNPNISTICLYINWQQHNSADGVFDFTAIGTAIDTILAAGKTFAIQVAGGKQAPSWLSGLGVPFVTFQEFEGAQAGLRTYTVPVFYNAIYKTKFKEFVTALADFMTLNNYMSSLKYLACWGINRSSPEFRTCSQVLRVEGIYTSTNATTIWAGAGYTTNLALATFQEFTLHLVDKFPSINLLLPYIPAGIVDIGDGRDLYTECLDWMYANNYTENLYLQYTAISENYNGQALSTYAKTLGIKISGELSEAKFSDNPSVAFNFEQALIKFFNVSGTNSFIEIWKSNATDYNSIIQNYNSGTNSQSVFINSNGQISVDSEEVFYNDENTNRFKRLGFTISYSFKNSNWVCHHNYLPNAMVHTSDNSLYLLDNYNHKAAQLISGLLWRHNSKKSFNRGFLYAYDSWIDFTKSSGNPQVFNYLVWKTTVFKVIAGLKQVHPDFLSTLKGVAAYNDTQLSPIYELDIANNDAYASIKKRNRFTRNNLDYWFYNTFFDCFKVANKYFIYGIDELDFSLANEKVFYLQKNFYGTWTTFRLFVHLSKINDSNVFGTVSYEDTYIENVDTDVSNIKQ